MTFERTKVFDASFKMTLSDKANIDSTEIESILGQVVRQVNESSLSSALRFSGTWTPDGSSINLITFTESNSPDYLMGYFSNPAGLLIRNTTNKGDLESPVIEGPFFLKLTTLPAGQNHTILNIDSVTSRIAVPVTATIDYFIMALKV